MTNTGLMRCYNFFPSHFGNIDDWTKALKHLESMNFNVVWVNPFLQSGQAQMSKTCLVNGVKQRVKSSMYAMADPTMVDRRYSVVKRGEQGGLELLPEQILVLSSVTEADQFSHFFGFFNQSLNVSEQYQEKQENYKKVKAKHAQQKSS